MTSTFDLWDLLKGLLATTLLDFALAFAFFTSLSYAVMGRRLGKTRAAVTVSACLGFALAAGLAWWEHENGWGIRNLGPIAIGCVLFTFSAVLFQSLRQLAGTWPAAGIALIVTYLAGPILGIQWPYHVLISQIIFLVILVLAATRLSHRRNRTSRFNEPSLGPLRPESVTHDIRRLRQSNRVSRDIENGLANIRREVNSLGGGTEVPDDVRRTLRQLLPTEGWLTQQLALLREKAQAIRTGHYLRINELQREARSLSPAMRQSVTNEIRLLYHELQLEKRIERLDRVVAETEKRIVRLTSQVEESLRSHDFRTISGHLDKARALQRHNTKLLRTIERTEGHLLRSAQNRIRRSRGAIN